MNCARDPHVVIVGAGIGGLAAAVRLAAAGLAVTVVERHAGPGGKIRQVPSPAGPVEAGPTVLTLRHVFDDIFTAAGASLDDHVRLTPLATLARHYWSDGATLDLMRDPAASATNVARLFGGPAARQFEAFSARAAALFTGFDGTMIQTARPSPTRLASQVLRHPQLLAAMAPHRTLAGQLARDFEVSRLAQLFGRYATYVGGAPDAAPALLALIWHAEAAGVWRVVGGMSALARALATLGEGLGVCFRFGEEVTEVIPGQPLRVLLRDGSLAADAVLFNGDPRALSTGLLGPAVAIAVPRPQTEPRSLSAYVLAFAARAEGPDLAHHNVFFADDPKSEFADLARGRDPSEPTLYVCAQDHDQGSPNDLARFEIIMNAPPMTASSSGGKTRCLMTILTRLARFGLRFDPEPTVAEMTAPGEFDRLFPGSQGALYGRSPSGLTAALKRPRARTRVPGLYLAGGGAHPGAGVPMAALSGRHAAEAMIADLASI